MGANMMKVFGAAAIAAATLVSVPAAAVVVTRDYVVSANFIQASAPVKSLVLSFRLTFDPQLSYPVDTPVLNYTSSSTAAQFNQTPIFFQNAYYPEFGNFLMIGGGAGGSAYDDRANDFFISLKLDDQGRWNPLYSTNVEYTFVGAGGITYNTLQFATVVTSTLVPGNIDPLPGGQPAVPEPATWAMLLVGFGAVGALTRRRQRIAAA